MRNNFNLVTMVTAALMATASGASAATVTFDLTGADRNNWARLPSSLSLTQGGLTATFDAKSWRSAPLGDGSIFTDGVVNDARIALYPTGAGVTSVSGDGHMVDGRGRKDFIEIRFDAPRKVTRVSFGFTDSDDDFRWMYDSNLDGHIGVGDVYSPMLDVEANSPFSGFGGLASRVFAIGAFGVDDNWKLRSVTVETSVIPLPAAGLLLLGGLCGLGLIGRRRRSTQA